VLITVPVDVARADQPLELFWRQLLAGGLPLQFSDDLVHANSIMNALGIAVSQAALPAASAWARLIAPTERSIADHSRAISTLQAESP
jgi:hypothetical protein